MFFPNSVCIFTKVIDVYCGLFASECPDIGFMSELYMLRVFELKVNLSFDLQVRVFYIKFTFYMFFSRY